MMIPFSQTPRGNILQAIVDCLETINATNSHKFPLKTIVVTRREMPHSDVPKPDLPRANLVVGGVVRTPQPFRRYYSAFSIRIDVHVDEGDENVSEEAIDRLEEDILVLFSKKNPVADAHRVDMGTSTTSFDPESTARSLQVPMTFFFIQDVGFRSQV